MVLLVGMAEVPARKSGGQQIRVGIVDLDDNTLDYAIFKPPPKM
jgi:hypothetical protein